MSPGIYKRSTFRLNDKLFHFKETELIQVHKKLDLSITVVDKFSPQIIPEKKQLTPQFIQSPPPIPQIQKPNPPVQNLHLEEDLGLQADFFGGGFFDQQANSQEIKQESIQEEKNIHVPLQPIGDVIEKTASWEISEVVFESHFLNPLGESKLYFNSKPFGSYHHVTKPILMKESLTKKKIIKKSRSQHTEIKFYNEYLQPFLDKHNKKVYMRDDLEILIFMMNASVEKQEKLNRELALSHHFVDFVKSGLENVNEPIFELSSENVTSNEILMVLNHFKGGMALREFTNFENLDFAIPQVRIGYQNHWMDIRPDLVRQWEKSCFEPYSEPKNPLFLFLATRNSTNQNLVPLYVKELSAWWKIEHFGSLNPLGDGYCWLDQLENINFENLIIFCSKEDLAQVLNLENRKPSTLVQVVDMINPNFADIVFKVFNKIKSDDSSDSYCPAVVLTEKSHEKRDVLHLCYFLYKLSEKCILAVYSILDSCGTLFDSDIIQSNSISLLIDEMYSKLAKMKQSTIVEVCIEKFNSSFDSQEMKNWEQNNPMLKFYEIHDDCGLQVIFHEGEKKSNVNKHSFAVKTNDSEYYIVSSFQNPFGNQLSDLRSQNYVAYKVVSRNLDKEKEWEKSAKQLYNLSWLTINSSWSCRESCLPLHVWKVKMMMQNLKYNGKFQESRGNHAVNQSIL